MNMHNGKPISAHLLKLSVKLADVVLGKSAQWTHPEAPDVPHQQNLPGATYSPWLGDAEFLECYRQIKSNTLVDQYRCYELWELGKQLAQVEGDYLEVGVWRGGTGCLLAQSVRNTRKTVFLADTFAGVVKAGERDTNYTGGEHADASEGAVLDLARRLNLGNVSILKGIFPDDTAHKISGKIALFHCDVDVYGSASDSVKWVLPRLSPGGAIVFDDYGFYGCEGVTRFVNELRQSGEGLFFVHNLNGHALLLKK